MRVVFYLCIMSIILVSKLSAQGGCEGYTLAYEAEIQYRSTQDYARAVTLYRAAFEAGIKQGSNVFDAITCATGIGDTKAAIYFLNYGLQIGIEVADYTRLWTFLGHDMDFNQLITLVDTARTIQAFQDALNKEWINEITLCAERDQQYRSMDTFDWNLQLANDSLNWKILKALTTSAGRIPQRSAIGMKASDDLRLLFYHMDKDLLEWFLPYVIDAIGQYECNLGEVILYQLDRIGMDEGVIYTLTDDYHIRKYARRTKMKNNMWCQSFGQWFDEQDMEGGQTYFTPLDPRLPRKEINRVRHLFCLDSIESKWKRKPWVEVVSIPEFEEIFRL